MELTKQQIAQANAASVTRAAQDKSGYDFRVRQYNEARRWTLLNWGARMQRLFKNAADMSTTLNKREI